MNRFAGLIAYLAACNSLPCPLGRGTTTAEKSDGFWMSDRFTAMSLRNVGSVYSSSRPAVLHFAAWKYDINTE